MGDDQVFTTCVKDNIMDIEYEEGWKAWMEHPELQQHIEELKGKLANSSTPGKGNGKTGTKGKSKQKGGHDGASK